MSQLRRRLEMRPRDQGRRGPRRSRRLIPEWRCGTSAARDSRPRGRTAALTLLLLFAFAVPGCQRGGVLAPPDADFYQLSTTLTTLHTPVPCGEGGGTCLSETAPNGYALTGLVVVTGVQPRNGRHWLVGEATVEAVSCALDGQCRPTVERRLLASSVDGGAPAAEVIAAISQSGIAPIVLAGDYDADLIEGELRWPLGLGPGASFITGTFELLLESTDCDFGICHPPASQP